MQNARWARWFEISPFLDIVRIVVAFTGFLFRYVPPSSNNAALQRNRRHNGEGERG